MLLPWRAERAEPLAVTFPMVAVPRTYRFEPVGGALRVPIDTPFWYATFPATVVHCDATMGTLLAVVTRPYWSTVTCETLAPEPYMPEVTPLVGNTPVLRVPNAKFDALIFARPEALLALKSPFTVKPVKVPTLVMLGWAGWTTELAVATVSTIALEWIP